MHRAAKRAVPSHPRFAHLMEVNRILNNEKRSRLH